MDKNSDASVWTDREGVLSKSVDVAGRIEAVEEEESAEDALLTGADVDVFRDEGADEESADEAAEVADSVAEVNEVESADEDA